MRQHVFLGFALLLVVRAHAEDWPEFRGPTGQGLYTGKPLPLNWGLDTNLIWRVAIPGRGWSSPVIVGSRVYLTTAVVTDEVKDHVSLRAMCLDSETGKIIWDREVFKQNGETAPMIHQKNSHASPTPIVRDKRLYVHFGHQGTACLDLDGKIIWTNRELTYDPKHGNGGSPVLFDSKLIFSADGNDQQFIVALNAGTGKVVWKTDRGTDKSRIYQFSFGTPLVIHAAGKDQVVSQGSGVINSFDAKTGKELWRVGDDGWSVIPRPVFGHGMVFACTGFVRGQLLAIKLDGNGDVTDTHVAWKFERAVPNTPSPLLVGDEIYMIGDGGVATCLDAKTGKAHWQERIAGTHSASPIHAGGRIYCLSEDGVGTVLQAGTTFKVLAKNELKERALASFAAADGSLFVRSAGHLYRIRER
jgi:outer membrane protein assembly factor BamB